MLEHTEQLSEIFSALSTERRIHTFEALIHSRKPADAARELDVARSTVQPYIDDFKDLEWITKINGSYQPTAKGNAVYKAMQALDDNHGEYTELQEFLRENPGVIPDEVMNEIRDNR